jgi:hypothetical protein
MLRPVQGRGGEEDVERRDVGGRRPGRETREERRPGRQRPVREAVEAAEALARALASASAADRRGWRSRWGFCASGGHRRVAHLNRKGSEN